jgi:hypothetical protein
MTHDERQRANEYLAHLNQQKIQINQDRARELARLKMSAPKKTLTYDERQRAKEYLTHLDRQKGQIDQDQARELARLSAPKKTYQNHPSKNIGIKITQKPRNEHFYTRFYTPSDEAE